MSATKSKGTFGQLLLLVAIVSAVALLFLMDNGAESRNQLEREKPISGVVAWEKSICSETLCKQELTVELAELKVNVSHQLDENFEVGDAIELVKVFEKRSALFSINKYERYNYTYEVLPPNS